jgi:hypothetical protein
MRMDPWAVRSTNPPPAPPPPPSPKHAVPFAGRPCCEPPPPPPEPASAVGIRPPGAPYVPPAAPSTTALISERGEFPAPFAVPDAPIVAWPPPPPETGNRLTTAIWFCSVPTPPRPAPWSTGSVSPPEPGAVPHAPEPYPASPLPPYTRRLPFTLRPTPPLPPPATPTPPDASPVEVPLPAAPVPRGAPLAPSPRASRRPPASIVRSPRTRMIAGFTPVSRTVTPLRMRNERYSKTTAAEPSVELRHVLRVAPVDRLTSFGGSKSSSAPSLAIGGIAAEHGPPPFTWPFAVPGPDAEVRLPNGPLSPSPATSRKPVTRLDDRAVSSSAVVFPVSAATSGPNSSASARVCSGRSSVVNANAYDGSGLPPKSVTVLSSRTTIKALSGHSPNRGTMRSRVASVVCVNSWSHRIVRAGTVGVPLPHVLGSPGVWSVSGANGPVATCVTVTVFGVTVHGSRFSLNTISTAFDGPTGTAALPSAGVTERTVGSAPGLASSNRSGSVSGRVWNVSPSVTVAARGAPPRPRTAKCSGWPITVTR